MRFRVEFENFSGQDAASARLQISPVHVEGVAIRDAIRSLKKNKTARPADLARKRPEFSAATAMRRYFRLLGACVRGNARFGRAAFSRVNAGYIGLQSAAIVERGQWWNGSPSEFRLPSMDPDSVRVARAHCTGATAAQGHVGYHCIGQRKPRIVAGT